MSLRFVLAIFVSLAAPVASGAQSPESACTGAKFKKLSVRYDPITDSTSAGVIGDLPTSLLNQKVDALYLEAKFGGKSSDSIVAPRMWLVRRMGVLDTEDKINVLADDSVRFSWAARLQVPHYASGISYGMGVNDVSEVFVSVPAADFARFAQAQHALVAVNGRRYELKAKNMLPFAELQRWAACPSDRKVTHTKK